MASSFQYASNIPHQQQYSPIFVSVPLDFLAAILSGQSAPQQQQQQQDPQQTSPSTFEQQRQQQQQQQFIPPIFFNFFMFDAGSQQQQQQFSFTPPHASEKARQSLHIVRDSNIDSGECPICQDHMAGTTVVRQMPCGHQFHEDCLFPWLDQSNHCPMCRYELMTDNTEYNEGVKRRMDKRQLPVIPSLPCDLEEIGCCWVGDCDEDVCDETKKSRLSCGHQFHQHCIRQSNMIKIALDGSRDGDIKIQDSPVELDCPKCRRQVRVVSSSN